jgi:hypothetical protein
VHPRLITENACVAITRRTTLRKAFLFPWAGSGHALESGAAAAWSRGASTSTSARSVADGERPHWDQVGQIFAYAAGLAQRATKIDWHQLVLVGTHHHSQATPRDRELAETTRILHRTTACAINAELRKKGFDAPGSVWDKRQTHWKTLVDVEAVGSRLVYDHLNQVAAGWVEHPLDVPFGHHLGFELWKAGGIAVPKPNNAYFSRRMPKEIELRLTPPIAMVRLFGHDVDAMVAWLQELRAGRLARWKANRVGPVRGVAKMRRVHPWDEPDSDKEVIGSRSQIYAVGKQGPEGDLVRERCGLDVVGHRDAHAHRIVRWKRGDRKSAFPSGTLRGHTFLGMPLDPPDPGAVLGTRHPSREEVELELAQRATELARREEERRERQRVRDERRARAEQIAEDEALERDLEELARRVRIDVDMDLDERTRRPIDFSGVIEALDPDAVVRRELGDERPDVDDGPRTIVLRARPPEDEPRKRKRKKRRRRRGRGRGANDPPQ